MAGYSIIGVKDHAVAAVATIFAVLALGFAYRSASDRRELERLRDQERLLSRELSRVDESFDAIRGWSRTADGLATGGAVPVLGREGGEGPRMGNGTASTLGVGVFGQLALAAREAPLNRDYEAPQSDLERFRATLTKIDALRDDADSVARRLRNLASLLRYDQGLLRRVPSMRPVDGRLTSGYGWRLSPFDGKKTLHAGLDIAAPVGSDILAPADGKVTFAGNFEKLGRAVVIHHGSGYETRFGHLSRMLVREGQMVRRGDVIAKVGNSGRSTGPHLHYEVYVRGQPVDPRDFLFDDMGVVADELKLAQMPADGLEGVGGDN